MSDSKVASNPEVVDSTTVDLDKEIPNYAKNIVNSSNDLKMSMQSSLDNVTQMATDYLASKWNETKSLMQRWSVGLDDEPQPQTGGRKRRNKTKKGRRKKHKGYTKKRKN